MELNGCQYDIELLDHRTSDIFCEDYAVRDTWYFGFNDEDNMNEFCEHYDLKFDYDEDEDKELVNVIFALSKSVIEGVSSWSVGLLGTFDDGIPFEVDGTYSDYYLDNLKEFPGNEGLLIKTLRKELH